MDRISLAIFSARRGASPLLSLSLSLSWRLFLHLALMRSNLQTLALFERRALQVLLYQRPPCIHELLEVMLVARSVRVCACVLVP